MNELQKYWNAMRPWITVVIFFLIIIIMISFVVGKATGQDGPPIGTSYPPGEGPLPTVNLTQVYAPPSDLSGPDGTMYPTVTPYDLPLEGPDGILHPTMDTSHPIANSLSSTNNLEPTEIPTLVAPIPGVSVESFSIFFQVKELLKWFWN